MRCPPFLPALAVAAVVLSSGTLAQPPAKAPALPPINPALARLDQTIDGLDGPGWALAASEPAGMIAAGCENGTVHLWHRDILHGIRTGRGTCNVWHGHEGPVTCLVGAGGPVLASAGVDHKVLLWSAADGQLRHTLPAGGIVRALAMSPDGQLLASGGDDPAVQLSQVATGKPAAVLAGHTDWVLCLTFSPDGKQLASAGYDGVIGLWDVAAAKKIRDLSPAPPPPPKTQPERVIVWSLAFSPDGKQLAAGTADGAIHLIGVTDGKVVRSLPGHTSTVTGLQFHPAGALLASASKDRTLRLWNPANGQAFKVLEGHEAWVQQVAFIAQGTRLASVGADQTVRIWDLTAPVK